MNQIKEKEHVQPENSSKQKSYLRKGKSTRSSHVPLFNLESGNENTHSSIYDNLYLIALRKTTKFLFYFIFF